MQSTLDLKDVPAGGSLIWLYCGCRGIKAAKKRDDGLVKVVIDHICYSAPKKQTHLAPGSIKVAADVLAAELEAAFH